VKGRTLLGICVITASPFVVTCYLTALRIMASDGVRKHDSTNHSWHNHHKHGKNFKKSRKNGPCSGLDVVFGAKGTLDKNLRIESKIKTNKL